MLNYIYYCESKRYSKLISKGTKNVYYQINNDNGIGHTKIDSKNYYTNYSVNTINYDYFDKKLLEIVMKKSNSINVINDMDFIKKIVSERVTLILNKYADYEFSFQILIETKKIVGYDIDTSKIYYNTIADITIVMTTISINKEINGYKYTADLLNQGWMNIFNNITNTLNAMQVQQVDNNFNFLKHYDIILSPEVAGMLVHEIIGHSLEGDYYLSGSYMSDRFREKVASNKLSVIDEPHGYLYDDLGNLSQKVFLIDCGILNGVMTDNLYSNLLSMPNTGNSFRSSYDAIAIPRMRKTYIKPTTYDSHKIINDTEVGVVIMSAVCGDIDITSGDFSMKVNNCYAIENGSISNRIPSFVYYGNALNILKNISDIGNDLIIKSDKCSKKGQLHTVYYGAPTIKINNQKLWS